MDTAGSNSTNADRYDTIIFDADDTLWRCEDSFQVAEAFYSEKVSPYASDGVDALDVLHTIEIDNVPISGYGVKPYALSMVQAAVAATGGQVPSSVIGELVDYAHDMLMHPVEILDGVEETLTEVGRSHRLALITKGDLLHQMRKVRSSGLAGHFERVRVVEEKDVDTYRQVFDEWALDPRRVVMLGNSVKSDVLPIVALGGHGIHVPYHVTWGHEIVEHDGGFTELGAIVDLPAWLRSF